MVCVPILQHCCPVRNSKKSPVHKTTVRILFHQTSCFKTVYSDEGGFVSTYGAVKVLPALHCVSPGGQAQVQLMTVIALKALNTLMTCSPHYIVFMHLCPDTSEQPGLIAFHFNLCQRRVVNWLPPLPPPPCRVAVSSTTSADGRGE